MDLRTAAARLPKLVYLLCWEPSPTNPLVFILVLAESLITSSDACASASFSHTHTRTSRGPNLAARWEIRKCLRAPSGSDSGFSGALHYIQASGLKLLKVSRPIVSLCNSSCCWHNLIDLMSLTFRFAIGHTVTPLPLNARFFLSPGFLSRWLIFCFLSTLSVSGKQLDTKHF